MNDSDEKLHTILMTVLVSFCRETTKHTRLGLKGLIDLYREFDSSEVYTAILRARQSWRATAEKGPTLLVLIQGRDRNYMQRNNRQGIFLSGSIAKDVHVHIKSFQKSVFQMIYFPALHHYWYNVIQFIYMIQARPLSRRQGAPTTNFIIHIYYFIQ